MQETPENFPLNMPCTGNPCTGLPLLTTSSAITSLNYIMHAQNRLLGNNSSTHVFCATFATDKLNSYEYSNYASKVRSCSTVAGLLLFNGKLLFELLHTTQYYRISFF